MPLFYTTFHADIQLHLSPKGNNMGWGCLRTNYWGNIYTELQSVHERIMHSCTTLLLLKEIWNKTANLWSYHWTFQDKFSCDSFYGCSVCNA